MRVFLLGYPGGMGGANTEAWHTIKLWRSRGVDVHLIPTWGRDDRQREKLDRIGCTTHHINPADLEKVPGLAGSIAVGMCNQHFMRHAHRLRAIGCPLVWINCMTFLFGHEREFFQSHGPADAMIFQSQFQRSQIEPQLASYGYRPETGHLIRGALALDEFTFAPRSHAAGEPFLFGRISRPDPDKWSSNTWPIYSRVRYQPKWAVMLGVNHRTRAKLGPAPTWAECLEPQSVPVADVLARLHCLLPINGGARENWPRVGLEAMAAGVPIVAQRQWGWREMIDDGRTGLLGGSDQELADHADRLARDEPLRQKIIHAAYQRLRDELANPDVIWGGWEKVFLSISDNPINGQTCA